MDLQDDWASWNFVLLVAFTPGIPGHNTFIFLAESEGHKSH